MHRVLRGIVLLGVCAAGALPAGAWDSTGVAGGDQAFSNVQPSIALNQIVVRQGIYPSRDIFTFSDRFLGSVRLFAGDFAPGRTAFADGQLLSISQNTALFSLLGTSYGGNGQTTFALPDLKGRAAIHAGQGPGLSERFVGEEVGNQFQLLTEGQMPGHDHLLTANETTSVAGGSQPFSNMQPSLAMNQIIALEGVYPSENGGTGGSVFLGEVISFAGSFAPGGWAFADGQLLPIAEYDALFSILGTTYGGDGQSTFALPDLRGRTVIGAGMGTGLSDRLLGEAVGVEHATLTSSQLPGHAHTLPAGGDTSIVGGNQPFDTMQPSLGLHYMIALQGLYPSPNVGLGDETFLGEVTLFAGDFAPRGWAFAEGQLLPINQNQALFSLLGTNYGGNGQTTFALPDLRGRALIHAGQGPWTVGQRDGAEQHTLTVAEMPAHDHLLPILGDTDHDFDVDLDDLNNVRNHFGEMGMPVPGDTSPFDGKVDLDDLNNVRNHFGEMAAPSQSVPEPSTLALLALCGVATWNGLLRQLNYGVASKR